MKQQVPPEMAELLKKLEDRMGKWGESPEKLASMGMVSGQRDNMIKMKAALERIEASDRKRLGDLREQLTRLQHGGGS